MRESCGLRVITLTCLLLSVASHAHAGTITGLTISSPDALVGATVSATATGNGLCGAVHINWGDGPGITYATSTLPVTQTHVYQTAGTYTVRAQGMGNCDGEATARVTIKAPPAPAPPPSAAAPSPKLTAIEMTPTPATPRNPVTISLRGMGACRVTLDFGDGNHQEIGGELPNTVRHTYGARGVYTITATPAAPCSPVQSATLQVGAPEGPAITGVSVEPIPDGGHGRRSIRVAGSGRCTYVVDFGDGNSETKSGILPDVVQHNYPAEGRYTVTATAQSPCVGTQRSTVLIGGREQAGAVTGITVTPQLARFGQSVTVIVTGSGMCRMTIDLDDGESRQVTERLPYRFTYRYGAPGDYEIVAWTSEPCSGEADALVRIQRR